MTVENFHQHSVELFEFYTNYLTTFANSDSKPQELTDLTAIWTKRNKADLKKLATLKNSALDNAIADLIESLIRKVELYNEQLNREIILIKSKETQDAEDIAKLRRYYDATTKYVRSVEEDFTELYFKFVKRNDLTINLKIEELRERLN
ncbi:MAG TPA: hypothetical protein PLP27_09960 [Crocinitomicaceae bacterium]|nr:hypothetical protein [Crocinitomicaceae bacterium]